MKRIIHLLLLSLLITSCDDPVVTNEYATLAAARADRLFERGWLPDTLPASTTSIRTSNDLDLNISIGEFSFSNADSAIFYGKLSPNAPQVSPFGSFQGLITKYSKQGYTQWRYLDSDTTWAFFCTPQANKCEYYAWSY